MPVTYTCSLCGDSSIDSTCVTLVRFPRCSAMNFIQYACGSCGMIAVRTVSEAVQKALRLADCEVRDVHLPAEVMEPRPTFATPLCVDDVLDFMLALDREDEPLAHP